MNVSGVFWRPEMVFYPVYIRRDLYRPDLIIIQQHTEDILVYTSGNCGVPHAPQEYIPTSLLLATKGAP